MSHRICYRQQGEVYGLALTQLGVRGAPLGSGERDTDLRDDLVGSPPGVGDPALVRMHIRNLREKLEENPSQPKLILTVGRQGYVIQED